MLGGFSKAIGKYCIYQTLMDILLKNRIVRNPSLFHGSKDIGFV